MYVFVQSRVKHILIAHSLNMKKVVLEMQANEHLTDIWKIYHLGMNAEMIDECFMRVFKDFC